MKDILYPKRISSFHDRLLQVSGNGDTSNIYSFLLMTGYLKSVSRISYNQYQLMIPNEEVRQVFITQFNNWFGIKQRQIQPALFDSIERGDEKEFEKNLKKILQISISFFDNQESFYHGFLVGLFTDPRYTVHSNRESGDGRFDIIIKSSGSLDTLVLIECKIAKKVEDLPDKAAEAVKQIQTKRYLENQEFEKYKKQLAYGISFYRKGCWVERIDHQS